MRLAGHEAVFFRVVQDDDAQQTALVMLNKSDSPLVMVADTFVESGKWKEWVTGEDVTVSEQGITATVPAHGVRVFVKNGTIQSADFEQALLTQMARQ